MKKIEILAPAGSFDSVIAAVRSGADAVYLGEKSFSARSSAKNFDDEELKKATAYCHIHGVKVYVTINTIVFDDELEKLKKANPAIGMSSDFIVGFPGETDADFEATLQLVREVGFIQAFSFKYSRRAGTPAAVMPGQVEEKAKTERLNALQELLSSQQLAFNRKCVGQTMPVLFESKGRGKNALYGRTPYMQNLNAELDKKYLNQIVNIEITAAGMNALSGKMKG